MGLALPAAGRLLTRLPRFRRNLWLFLLSCVFIFVGIGVQALVLNLYLASIGFREDFMGLYSFANTAGIGVAALLAAQICNRLGSRPVLLGATAVLAVSSAALVLTTNAAVLVGIALVNGAALAYVFVPCATFVMDNVQPEGRTAAYAGYFTAQSLAQVIGSYLGGVMPTLAVGTPTATARGYGLTLLASGILVAVGMLPLVFADDGKAEGSGAYTTGSRTSFQEQRRQARRDLRWLIGCNALTAVALGLAVPFFNVFFRDRHAATTAQIGYVFAVGSLAMVVASLLGPSVGKRFGTVPTIVAARGFTAPILLGLVVSPTLTSSAALYVGRILVNNLTWPIDNAFAMELVPPDTRTTLAALRSTSWNLAWAVASGVAGLMIVRFGYPSVFVASAAFVLIGSAAYYLGFHSRALNSSPGAAVANPAAAPEL